MREFFESLRKQIEDRMSSPVLGSFVIAWVAWNHQYLVILFSGLPVEYRFTLARSLFYPTFETGVWRFLGLPAITSLGYVLLYPPLSIPFLLYWDWLQTIINRLRNKVQSNELLTRSLSRKIISDSVAARTKYEERISELEREIDALKNPNGGGISEKNPLEVAQQRIAALEGELKRRDAESSPQNPLSGLKEETVRGIEALLKILAELPGEDLILESKALERLKLDPVFARHILDKALQAQIVFRQGDNNAVHLRLNERGREYVIDHKLNPTSPSKLDEPVLPLPVDSSTQFHRIIRLLAGKISGMLGSELKVEISIPEAELRELLDELKQRKYVVEEIVDSRRGEYRYRLTQEGTAVAKRLP